MANVKSFGVFFFFSNCDLDLDRWYQRKGLTTGNTHVKYEI